MRIPRSVSQFSGRPDVAMTPMIDVVFLLLVFFIWTASFQIVEWLLPSRLSVASGPGSAPDTQLAEEDFERVVVRIRQVDGTLRWSVNDYAADRLDAVRSRLAQVAAIRKDVPLLIDPDPPIPLGDVTDVYDLARQLGFDRIQFTVHEPL